MARRYYIAPSRSPGNSAERWIETQTTAKGAHQLTPSEGPDLRNPETRQTHWRSRISGEDYFQSLTGGRCVEKLSKTGRVKWIWEKLRPNEALDCRAYATAAAYLFGLDKFKAEHWVKLKSSLGLIPEPYSEDQAESFSILGSRS